MANQNVDPTKHYAQTVNGQINPNSSTVYNEWKNEANAVGHTQTFAKAKYSRKISKKGNYYYITPVYLTAHDFQLNIPKEAYIQKVVVQVCAKIDNSDLNVKAPSCWFMVYGGKGTKNVSEAKANKTGWHNGAYRVYSDEKLSTSEKVFDYAFTGKEWNKMGYPSTALNQSKMGVDIHFDAPLDHKCKSGQVLIKWVRIRVNYDLPDYYIAYTPSANIVSNNPLEMDINERYNVKVGFGNRNVANGGNQKVYINLPLGTVLDSYSPNTANLTQVDTNKYKWTVDGSGNAVNKVTLGLHSEVGGLRSIVSTHKSIEYPFYIEPLPFADRDYANVRIESNEVKQMQPSCFFFSAKVNSHDGNVDFDVVVESENRPDISKVSDAIKETFPNGLNRNFLVEWELYDSSLIQGATINHSTSDSISFDVPPDTDVELKFRGCFIPIESGQNTLVLTNTGDNSTYSYSYYATPFETLEVPIQTETILINDHRVLNTLDTAFDVLPFTTKVGDKVMVEKSCGFRMHIQEQVPYIGCIPIKHAHHDPSSSFGNDGLISQYKNKTYTGKKGELEEDRDLKIWLPKQDWTTLEGLSELDKPIPLNTVPAAYEGDVLNHRGWAELTKVKVDKKSPLYYHGSLDLTYLTHNINSRFMITKGGKVIDEKFETMMSAVLESGDEFANTTYINQDGERVTNSTGYFNVDTDGIYIYDDDAVENQRTLISLDNSQYATIITDEPLPEHFNISCEWSSTKIPENRENNIERIISLYDGNNQPILEYEYFDFEFTDTAFYKCTVQCRVMTFSGWEVLFEKDINLSADLESLNLTRDVVTGELVSESEPYIDELVEDETDTTIETEAFTYSDYTYGSTVHFKVDMNELTILDEGMSGIEVSQTIPLDYAPRYYQIKFANKNTDGDTNDVYNFFDFEVEESVLLSDFEKDYANLVVSSFPIRDKTLIFTRECEEGTLYYYKDDNTLFSYMQEPFYMYFCGVDLKANNDVSIFNLNNSYRVFYLQNGLVRIGFDRFDGEIYLAKYDIYSRQYITVSYLQLTNYTDFNIGAYSDDKIEVVAGTTVFTMYRGHPYVVVKHEDDDIQFKSVWNRVYGESVNGQALDIPALWELVNYNNMLPVEIAGENVDVSGWIVDSDDEEEDANINTTLNLQKHDNSTVYNNEDVIFDISGTVTSSEDTLVDEVIPVDDVETFDGFLGTYSMSIEVDTSVPHHLNLIVPLQIIQTGQNIALKGMLEDFDGNGVSGKRIDFYEVFTPVLSLTSDKSIIQSGQTANLQAKVKDEDGNLIDGVRVDFYINE